MYEDLTEPTQKDLEEKLKQLKDALHESRDWMLDKQNECDVLKNIYNNSFNDAKRFSKVLKEVYETIKDKNLHDDFENTGIDDLINE